jgi:outer membrane protein assembly factor BamB
VLLQSPTDLTAYDPETGKARWVFATQDASTIPSPVSGDDLVFIPGREFCAIKPREDGVTPDLLWKSGKFNLSYPSPVYHQGKLYLLTRNIVSCVSAVTGEELWKERVESPFSATPVLADGKLYVVNEKGTTSVIQLGDQPKVLANNKIDDTILATPAIAGGAIYLRSDKYLYCIGEKK